MARTHKTERIVVGIDGSEPGNRALAWALQEAKLRGDDLLLVHAYDYGPAAASPYPGQSLEQISDDAESILNRAVAETRLQGVHADGLLEYGSPVHALVEASKDAAMLVVGSRGRGALTGALLGSTSTGCVHHAHCPVVVIPPADGHPAAGSTVGAADTTR